MPRAAAVALVLSLLLAPGGRSAEANIELPPHLASHMVVQAGQPLIIAGRAEPGIPVQISFAGTTVRTTPDRDGRFRAELPPPATNATGRAIELRQGDDRLVLDDVLVGEVWLCSGQSNMEWPVRACDRFDAVQADADHPLIRTFNAAHIARADPQDAVPGRWLVCSPASVGEFSGTAYHFGRRLHDQLEVPIGLLHVSWGGSRSEAWTSPEALASSAAGRRRLARADAVRTATAVPVASVAGDDVDDSAWAEGPVPGYTSAFGIADGVDGVFWMRIPLEIPARWQGRDLQLSLGMIDDHDTTWFAGVKIGETEGWQTPRRYTVPGALVEAGRRIVAIRIRDTGGPGGLHGDPAAFFVHPADAPEDRLAIRGPARLKLVAEVPSIPPQHQPADLYRGMIHPLRDVNIAGVIWYQGESNAMGAGSAAEYAELLPLLIGDWRRAFDAPELPFLIVQIANLAYRVPDWDFPGVRDVQRRMLELPATGLTVTTDIGDPDDIHPRNKHDVGDRLARWALVDVYGASDIVPSGPLVDSAAVADADSILVRFESFGSPLTVAGLRGEAGGEGHPVGSFEIAGDGGDDADGSFIAAAAVIEDATTVRVGIPRGITRPARLRYAWRPDPVDANLVNAAGLPAAAFEITIAPRAGRAGG
jgi:sialate O-acetylesterase